MKLKFDDVIDALESHGMKPRKAGGGIRATCPAHADDDPSLSVREDKEGDAAVKCFGGCSYAEITAALGFGGSSPLLPARRPTAPKKSDIPKEPPKPQPLPDGPNVTRYYYPDADGVIIMAVTRRDLPSGKKKFSQWTPTDDPDVWLPVAPDIMKPLYRLPDVAKSTGKIAVVEGEKCVHAARKAWPFQTVTCWPGGTNTWDLADWTPVAGREVSLLSDADEPGRKAMLGLAKYLFSLGCIVSIGLPDGDNGEDVADWLATEEISAAARRIASLLRPFEPEAMEAEVLDLETGDRITATEIADNDHYKILGMAGDSVAVRIRGGRIFQQSRESLTQRATLVSLAPLAWWTRLTGTERLGKRDGAEYRRCAHS